MTDLSHTFNESIVASDMVCYGFAKSHSFDEFIVTSDKEYYYSPKRGVFKWYMERYRSGNLLDFPYEEVEELMIKLSSGEEVDTYEFKVDRDVDVEEGDVFVIWIGYSETGLKKRISGPVVKVKRARTRDEEINIVTGVSWLNILKEYSVTPGQYEGEVKDIVLDVLSDVSTPNPGICERKISLAGVETFNKTITITFNEGETLWDALKEIADVADADFYIDADKVLHFFPAGSKTSNLILQFEEHRTYNCLSFDGQDDYLEIADSPDLRFGTSSFTISFWVKAPATETYGGIIGKTSSTTKWDCFRDGASPTKMRWRLVGDTGDFRVTQPETIFDDTWHHCVWVVDRSNNVSYWYFDGVKSTLETDISGLGDISNTSPVRIGRVDTYLDGELDDIRIYNRVLSVDEILTLANRGHVSDGLIVWLPLDEDVVDKSGNNHTPINYGASWSSDGFFNTTIPAFDIEETEYYLSTDEIYNKITVLGAQQESYEPTDKDTWTEYSDPSANGWSIGASDGSPYFSTPSGMVGSRCVQGNADVDVTWLYIKFSLPSSIDCTTDNWDLLTHYLRASNLEVEIRLQTSDTDYYYQTYLQDSEWKIYQLQTDTTDWETYGSPSWSNIQSIKWYARYYPATFDTAKFDISRFDTSAHDGNISVDGLYFTAGSIRVTVEDEVSQSIYGILSLTYIDRTITTRTHARLMAERLLSEYAYPMPVFERTLCSYGLEDINPGELVRVITKDVNRELRVASIEYRYVEDYEITLSLTKMMETIETSIESMEQDVRKLEVA